MPTQERMDVEAQVEHLNTALRFQHRSVLLYSLTAGSVIGLEYQAHADRMHDHARLELEDATRLVEKITALGGEPPTKSPRSVSRPTRRMPSTGLWNASPRHWRRFRRP